MHLKMIHSVLKITPQHKHTLEFTKVQWKSAMKAKQSVIIVPMNIGADLSHISTLLFTMYSLARAEVYCMKGMKL